MTTPAKQNTRVMGFNDPTIRGGFNDRPEKYSAVPGRVDRVRIMSDVLVFYGANVKFKTADKGFFEVSRADAADCEAAIEGDADALARCKAACPLWARGYKVERRFAVLMVHVAKADGKGRSTKVMQPIVFAFGGDKYQSLHGIYNALPAKADGSRYHLRAIEIGFDCTDKQFQRINMIPYTDPKQHLSTLAECRDLISPLMDNPEALSDPNGCSLLRDFTAPESFQRIAQSLDRAEGLLGGDDGDEFSAPAAPAARRQPAAPAPAARTAAPAARRQPAAPPPAATEPEATEPEAADDLSSEIDSALASLDPDPEQPAPPARRQPAAPTPKPAARRPAAAPAAPAPAARRQPAAPPADDESAGLGGGGLED